AGRVRDLVAKPEIVLATPAAIAHAKRFEPVSLAVKVRSLLGEQPKYAVKMFVGSDRREMSGKEASAGDFVFNVTPFVRQADDRLAVEVLFADGFVRGLVADRAYKAGKAGTKLSELRRIERRGEKWAMIGRGDAEEIVDKLPGKLELVV